MNIEDYGFNYDSVPKNKNCTPARVTAVHKGRFGIVSDFGEGYAQLKSKEYYYEGEAFADDKTDFQKQKQQWGKNLRKYEKNKKKKIWTTHFMNH